MKLRIVLDTLRRPPLQLVDEKRMGVGPFGVFRPLALRRKASNSSARLRRHSGRSLKLGNTMSEATPCKLRRAAGDAIKFLDGQFERAILLVERLPSNEVNRPISRIVCTVPLPKVLPSPTITARP